MQWEWCFCMLVPCTALRESSDAWSSSQIGKSPASQSSLTVLSVEWFHTRCYWMSTKRFKILVLVSTNTACYYHTPLFFTPFSYESQKTNSVTHLALGFYIYNWKKKNQYFEYYACRTRCLNQIYEDTNLHLVSLEGVSLQKQGAGFPKTYTWSMPLKAVYVWIENFIFKALLKKSINDSLETKLILFWETWLCF